ncbi:GtrA family protein [Actinokineospora sp. HUAS TT18]|uniref:GtrA family protein n=1 Tax=Actinokineospora sp. HUAS TT18 TaxID=3447451 RepID=UPI003F5288ED
MPTIAAARPQAPARVSALARHRDLIRFAVVGGGAFAVTLAVNYSLKLTVLTEKPVTALAIATTVSTVVAYLLSRHWSFAHRGGRQTHHEATLFLIVNAIAVGLNLLPPLVSRYVLHLRAAEIGFVGQEVADFVSGMIIGTLLGTAFRWWAYKKLVFPTPKP